MGITKIAKLQRQLDAALDATRNAGSAAQTARIERDQARMKVEEAAQQLIENDRHFVRLQAESRRDSQHIRRLFNSIFHLNLELARKAGYIDRVKEMDSVHVGMPVVSEPDMGTIIDRERDNLANARSDRRVASVIDGMDSEVLDQVLGRDDEADYDRG